MIFRQMSSRLDQALGFAHLAGGLLIDEFLDSGIRAQQEKLHYNKEQPG